MRLTDLTAFSGTAIDDLDEFWLDDYNNVTVTMTSANPCVVTKTAHGLVAGNKIVFTTTGTLPTNVVSGTEYYILSAGLTANAFEISATNGGTAIDSTLGTQSGVHTGTYYVSRKMSGLQLKTLLSNTSYSVTLTPTTINTANTITHNLNSTDVVVELWDDTTGELILTDVKNRSANAFDIYFGENPASTVRVVVLSKGGLTSDSRPYKVLTYRITQSSTSAPTLVTLENTTGQTPTTGYTTAGTYTINSSALFTNNKTCIFHTGSTGTLDKTVQFAYTSTSVITIYTWTNAPALANGLLQDDTLEIRIYN